MGGIFSKYRQIHHDLIITESGNSEIGEGYYAAIEKVSPPQPKVDKSNDPSANYEVSPATNRKIGDSVESYGTLASERQTNSECEVKWKRGARIGNGAYGDVYLALCESDGSLMAVKCLSIKERQGQHFMEKIIRSIQSEIETLRSLSHKNIVRYRGTEITDDDLHIFMDYVPGGSIASLIKKFGPMCDSLISVYMKQILQGLGYLHKHKVLHRDLKGANILVDTEGNCKLADFGASKKLDEFVTEGEHSIRGTPYWMAPEIIRSQAYGYAADIWSIGCTIIEMATGKPPWSDICGTHVQAIYLIATSQQTPVLPEHFSPALRACAHACLQREQNTRPSARELLKFDFFQLTIPEEEAGFEWVDQDPLSPLPSSKVNTSCRHSERTEQWQESLNSLPFLVQDSSHTASTAVIQHCQQSTTRTIQEGS
mmetsp:Transcript_19082/g.24659  ORF Transcript_19082/g.24659 Transcript_19082/m.24659 type:complete len:427 (+) Transcript_19082:66-1346(+)